MPPPLPTATIRTQMAAPLRFADGYATAARVFSFDGLVDGQEHLALGLGDRAAAVTSAGGRTVPLVRPHSECLTGDVFGSQRCDCGPQLREAVKRITKHGGYVLYLRQEGRGSPSSCTACSCKTPSPWAAPTGRSGRSPSKPSSTSCCRCC